MWWLWKELAGRVDGLWETCWRSKLDKSTTKFKPEKRPEVGLLGGWDEDIIGEESADNGITVPRETETILGEWSVVE